MKGDEFFSYWESMGFFDDFNATLPPNFFILFEIAKNILTDETKLESISAVDELSKEDEVYVPERDETIEVNRTEHAVPIGNNMEIESFKKIYELKRLIPRELAQDDLYFDMKFFTRELQVQKFKDSSGDKFTPISSSMDSESREANVFEQKFYILFDRSRSMEKNMRNYYSKFIVAEILRKKKGSRAKLYFRSFDSEVGSLYTIEKPDDFVELLERIMSTDTGGTGTDFQLAISKAVDDIRFESDQMKTDILLVTDGISKIDKDFLKNKLGDIKLNILKIGDEYPDLDYGKLVKLFENEGISFDPLTVDIMKIREKLNLHEEGTTKLPLKTRRIYKMILDDAEDMFSEIRSLSKTFIEIGDLNVKYKAKLTDETLNGLKEAVSNLRDELSNHKDIEFTKNLYKKTVMLKQYVQMYMENGSKNSELKQLNDELSQLQLELLKDKELYDLVIDQDNLHADKKTMKEAQKEQKKLKQKLNKEIQDLTLEELKNVKLKISFSMDIGKGNMLELIKMLLKKLWLHIKDFLVSRKKNKE